VDGEDRHGDILGRVMVRRWTRIPMGGTSVWTARAPAGRVADQMARVAFLGLGHMGQPMAANLIAAAHEVVGFDPTPDAAAAAERAGARIAASARGAVDGVDAVVTMLPSGRHLLECYDDVLPAVAPDTLLVDCSTVDVAASRAAHERAARLGSASVDAPVSGGVVGAEAATLTFMCGGEETAVERARPLLAAMGSRIVHTGGAGAGQAAKICNNMSAAISMIGTSEAFALGERLGLSAGALYEVLSTSSGQCWAVTVNCPVAVEGGPDSPAHREYRPGFAAELMLKDLGLAADEAAGEVATELGAHALAHYRRYVEEGGRGTDFSGIVRWIRDRDHDAAPSNHLGATWRAPRGEAP
jgi:3-hydroxyisobutyrate dehydrogenase